jgi:hypothetical protein
MANEKGVLRSVVVPALLAMACVGLLAFFLSGRSDKEPAAEPEPALPAHAREAAAAAAPAPARTPEPALSDAATLASVDAAAGPSPTLTLPDASVFTPEIKLHAQKLVPPTVLQAVEQGNLAHVRSLRDQLSARASEGLLAPSDLEALDLVVECMENATDAREEARDLLQFGSATILSEALKAACNQ